MLRASGAIIRLSMEKLSPILAFYVVDGLGACAKRRQEILAYGGMGHTAGIHTRSREAAVQFGAEMPASRITVNTPTTHGAIGFSTALPPSMTLGCGSWGGNVTSDHRLVVDADGAFFVERHGISPVSVRSCHCASTAARQGSPRLSTMRRRPCTERRVVAAGSEGACVSMVSVKGASCAGNVAASRAANGISPSPMATKRRAALA